MPPKERKRAREPAAAAGDAGASGSQGPPAPAGRLGAAASAAAASALSAIENRQAQAADIARRRAAHFAHFDEDGDDGVDANASVHAGGSNARTLGPWSSAVELVNAREAAAAAREDRLQGRRGEEEAEAEDDIEWTPSRLPGSRLPALPSVPTLSHMCVALLTEYADCIETLAGVPDVIKVKLAAAVCANRAMAGPVAQLFAAAAPGEVRLPDCHQLDPSEMSNLLRECATPALEALELGFCGRGFGEAQATVLSTAGPLPRLTQLTLGGAYRLSNAALETVLSALPHLKSLRLPQCSLLSAPGVDALPSLVPLLERLDLTDCRGVLPEALFAALPKLQQLRSLSLDGCHQVGDDVVRAAATLPELRELRISFSQVTDVGIAALAAGCKGLRVLVIDECLKLNDAALVSVAEGCKELQVLSVRRCARLTDEGLCAVASCGSLVTLVANGVPGVGPATMRALASHCGTTLAELDVSFCRGVSERALGLVADSCPQLRRLKLHGCSQVGNTFLRGHSNDALVDVVGVGTLVQA